MRCVAGVVLFIVLYFASLQLVKEIVTARAIANDGYSPKAAATAGRNAMSKYHAILAAGSGVVSIVACCLPSILMRMSERSERRAYEEYERA